MQQDGRAPLVRSLEPGYEHRVMGAPSRQLVRLLGLDRGEVRSLVESLGEPAYRGDQVFGWIHAKGVVDPGAMTDLPMEFRARLAGAVDLAAPPVVSRLDADDGTVKLAIELHDGYRVESVIIPREDPEGEEDAGLTLCVSTQVGCRVGCRFCRSGREGFRRNLDATEIVAQLAAARSIAGASRVKRIVFMGIGEPLDNYEALARSIRILTDAKGAAMAPRRIVVSTVGRIEGMRRLGEDFGGRVGLAVSLHAADPGVRSALVEARGMPSPDEIARAARAYPVGPRGRVTIEVVLVRGVNSSPAQAGRLAALLGGLRCRVNLIPLNPFDGLDLEPPGPAEVERFQERIGRTGIRCLVRRRRGAPILASCGQLAFGGGRSRKDRG